MKDHKLVELLSDSVGVEITSILDRLIKHPNDQYISYHEKASQWFLSQGFVVEPLHDGRHWFVSLPTRKSS